jgi:hypothetical protein
LPPDYGPRAWSGSNAFLEGGKISRSTSEPLR